jgi:hypothetical protein
VDATKGVPAPIAELYLLADSPTTVRRVIYEQLDEQVATP